MNVKNIVSEVLKEEGVNFVIGYSEGSSGKVRPAFIKTEEEADKLVYDSRCKQNLASYLVKKDIKKTGKMAIVANVHTLRGIIRLAGEHQLRDGNVTALIVDDKGEATALKNFEEMEAYLETQPTGLSEEDKATLAKLDAMTPKERWDFWQDQFAKCFKCYACRQACPLCYCDQCTTEMNQPQWISVPSHKLGNMEWHLMRTMHLAGRCVECGECGRACPMDIPLHLLTYKAQENIKAMYGEVSGVNRKEGCALSTFKPEDKESFIG